MILNFPPSASLGDTYTSDNAIYTYNGSYWQVDGTTLGAYVANLPTTGSNTFTGNQIVNGNVITNGMMNLQTITDNVTIPTGYNALLIGNVGFENELSIEDGAVLVII